MQMQMQKVLDFFGLTSRAEGSNEQRRKYVFDDLRPSLRALVIVGSLGLALLVGYISHIINVSVGGYKLIPFWLFLLSFAVLMRLGIRFCLSLEQRKMGE